MCAQHYGYGNKIPEERVSMKKGYQCPQCGNNKTHTLKTLSQTGTSLTVLLAAQKLLNLPDIQIACTVCGCQAEADIFRTRKIYQHAASTAHRSGLH
jgi:predicted nucleic-acid-binding Zn-ribbon protein